MVQCSKFRIVGVIVEACVVTSDCGVLFAVVGNAQSGNLYAVCYGCCVG